MAGVEELGTADDTSVQADPSQCSMSTPAGCPVGSVVEPEAQQSVASAHANPDRYPPPGLG